MLWGHGVALEDVGNGVVNGFVQFDPLREIVRLTVGGLDQLAQSTALQPSQLPELLFAHLFIGSAFELFGPGLVDDVGDFILGEFAPEAPLLPGNGVTHVPNLLTFKGPVLTIAELLSRRLQVSFAGPMSKTFASALLIATGLSLLAGGCGRTQVSSLNTSGAAPSGSSPARISNWNMKDQIVKTEAEWQKQLTPGQFHVLREKGTERAFTGDYWNNHEPGAYYCAGCGLELFGSDTKFDSRTGWPSFFQPLKPEHVGIEEDNSLFMRRTEVHCARCGGHLGHVFDDGPKPTGRRYCINSAALKFEKQ